MKNISIKALCRNLQSNKWQWFDDNRVVEVDINIREFLTARERNGFPVCLFYERETILKRNEESKTINKTF